MKKFFAVLFVIIISFTALTISVCAATGELLTNPGFESGSLNGFIKMGAQTNGSVSREYAQSGNYGLKISNRKQAHSTYVQDVTNILKTHGQGIYQFSVWIRLADGQQPSAKAYAVLRLCTADNKYTYITSSQKSLSASWQQFTIKTVVALDSENPLQQTYLYPQTPSDSNEIPDICVDNYSLKQINSISNIPVTDISGIARSKTTTVGAIRWDAWYSHDGKNGSVISQVERSLSPARFHYRAPFFAEITGTDKLIIPEYTQEIFDREMEYAKYAGIDYFAYVWYNSDMKAARKFHTSSKYRNSVKMCVCFDGNAINKDYARRDMRTILKQDYYMTVLNGRPLMYYYCTGSNIYEIYDDIVYYRQLAKEIGVKEPFAVIMGTSPENAKYISGDGVSRYAVTGNGLTYNQLTGSAYKIWEDFNSSDYQFVPTVTTGWSPEPRYVNPVSWGTVQNGSWCKDGTSKEIYEHLAYALSYMQHSKVKENTKANTVLMYAWNEHDEGGWICPTLKVDKNGKQLYNQDGTKQLDETRINAVKLAIDFYKSGNLVSVTSQGISNGAGLTNASIPFANIDALLNAKVFEGISWKNQTAQPTPYKTANLSDITTSAATDIPTETAMVPDTTDIPTPAATESTMPTDAALSVSSLPAITAQPNGSVDSKNTFTWYYFLAGAIIIAGIGIPVTVLIKRKKR